jgi:hypothetical protein
MSKILQINLILFLLIFSSSSFVLASFSIPSYVYTVGQLDSARSVAEKTNKPITFVYSDKNTDCSLATAASIDLFQGLKNYSVVVYAERKDWNKLPYAVQSSINLPGSGEYIPTTVVVDSGCNNMICVIPYAKTEQRRQLIKQAQQLLSN